MKFQIAGKGFVGQASFCNPVVFLPVHTIQFAERGMAHGINWCLKFVYPVGASFHAKAISFIRILNILPELAVFSRRTECAITRLSIFMSIVRGNIPGYPGGDSKDVGAGGMAGGNGTVNHREGNRMERYAGKGKRPMPFTEEQMRQVFDTNLIDFAVKHGYEIEKGDQRLGILFEIFKDCFLTGGHPEQFPPRYCPFIGSQVGQSFFGIILFQHKTFQPIPDCLLCVQWASQKQVIRRISVPMKPFFLNLYPCLCGYSVLESIWIPDIWV